MAPVKPDQSGPRHPRWYETGIQSALSPGSDPMINKSLPEFAGDSLCGLVCLQTVIKDGKKHVTGNRQIIANR